MRMRRNGLNRMISSTKIALAVTSDNKTSSEYTLCTSLQHEGEQVVTLQRGLTNSIQINIYKYMYVIWNL